MNDLIDEATHMARVATRQIELLAECADELNECRAFLADRERQRRPYAPRTATILPFRKRVV